MKKIIRLLFVLVFGFMVLPSHAATATDDIEIADSDQDWKPVIEALIQVESKGDIVNAVGGYHHWQIGRAHV